MEGKRYQPFKVRILAAAVIANLATMAGVMILPRILPEPAACREFRETMGALERSADKEKTVTGFMIGNLRPAGRGNPYENNMLIASVIALIATQAFCLFAFLLATASDAEEEADAMSRLIDEMLAKKQAKEKDLPCFKS